MKVINTIISVVFLLCVFIIVVIWKVFDGVAFLLKAVFAKTQDGETEQLKLSEK